MVKIENKSPNTFKSVGHFSSLLGAHIPSSMTSRLLKYEGTLSGPLRSGIRDQGSGIWDPELVVPDPIRDLGSGVRGPQEQEEEEAPPAAVAYIYKTPDRPLQ